MNDGWFSIAELGGGLFRITEPKVHVFFRANMFLLRGRDADLLIDFGMGLRQLAPVVGALSSGAPLIALATHSHADHIGGFCEFADRCAHESEAEACAEMADRRTYAHLFRGLEEAVKEPPVAGFEVADYRIRPAPLAVGLSEGDLLDLGDRQLEVLHLPGHSPGSIGLLDRASGLFFAGDAVYRGMLVDDLPDSDRVVYRETMKRISALEVSIAHGGHGEAMTQDEMRAIAGEYLAR